MKFIVRFMPERARFLKAMREQIPGLIIVMDKTRNAMDTFCDGLREAGDEAAVHMEDDILLTSDFYRKVMDVIHEHPDVPIQFFSRLSADLEKGSRWMPGSSFSMNQCHYMPARIGLDLLAYKDKWPKLPEHPWGYDTMMGDFFAQEGIRYWLHVPSLVQHAEAKSLIGARSSKRQSPSFVP